MRSGSFHADRSSNDHNPYNRGTFLCVRTSARPAALRSLPSRSLDNRILLSNQFYVAPDGTPSGDGSINKPWNLQTALSQPAAVKPGDVIWVRGGTYVGNFQSSLSGTANSPIVVREFSGERATLDGTPRLPHHQPSRSMVSTLRSGTWKSPTRTRPGSSPLPDQTAHEVMGFRTTPWVRS